MPRQPLEPELLPGEQVLRHQKANRQQNTLRQVGGRLFVTNLRIAFVPSRLDERTGGGPGEWSMEQAIVETRQRTAAFLGLTARLRRRLRLELRDGSVELFVVNGVDELARMVSRVVDGTGKH